MRELNDVIGRAIDSRSKIAIPNQNLHGVYLYHRRPLMRALHEEWDVHVDGMSLILLGRLLGIPVQPQHRVTYVDWMQTLMPLSASMGWRIFYLGSLEGVADRGAQILREQHSGLQIATHHGHFDCTPGSADNEGVLEAIRGFQPDILMVGMGMPLQEEWIYLNWSRLDARVVLPSGAAMDYVAGVVTTPPRWIGRVGLEWFYRLVTEPRRLAKRYLVEPWALLALFLKDVARRVRRRNSSSVCYWNPALEPNLPPQQSEKSEGKSA